MPDFELMVIIDQEVTQLEVTGNDVRGVNVLETAKGLMNKRPEMSVGEWLLGADLCREHSVAQLADAERGASFAMVCRSASINSDSWKVRVSLYQTETRVGVREGNARINKPRQDFNLVRKPDPCRRDAPRIWAPLEVGWKLSLCTLFWPQKWCNSLSSKGRTMRGSMGDLAGKRTLGIVW